MKRFLTILRKAMKLGFIVLLIFGASLFFRSQQIPVNMVEEYLAEHLPTNIVVHADSLAFGLNDGLTVRNLVIYDLEDTTPEEPILSAREIAVHPFRRLIEAENLKYPRLPKGYYAEGNSERNSRIEVKLPIVPRFSLVLNRPDILGIAPEKVIADVEIKHDRLSVERIHLDWADRDEPMTIDGFCTVDFSRQVVQGEINGFAKQSHIRPLLVALDVPVSLPYMDAFTEVQGKVPARCGWNVNLINNDFDLFLGLKPKMGKYNGVKLSKAEGKLHIHAYTRGDTLNYRVEVGPLVGAGLNKEPLEGSVIIEGVGGENTVTVEASSGLPVAHLLKIGGFTGDYVDDSVVGKSSGKFVFRFPRSMGDDISKLNGEGSFRIEKGQVLRMKGFAGLLDLLASHIPGVSLFTDSTQASCSYVIDNGILKSDDIYIEGTVFSIKMYGQQDLVNDKLDFTVRVQFTKKDSMVGQLLHPLAWPFTKLLLEFKLTGSSEEPQWEYISVIDRVLEATK